MKCGMLMEKHAYSLLDMTAQVTVEVETVRLCPALKLVAKDATHAARRVLQISQHNDEMIR